MTSVLIVFNLVLAAAIIGMIVFNLLAPKEPRTARTLATARQACQNLEDSSQ
jgi:hypothetical protein